ncbi:hypothetical protein U1Q18_046653, partial [Sarracenia purpurea var. burkii]
FGHATEKCKANKQTEGNEGWIQVGKGKGKAQEAHNFPSTSSPKLREENALTKDVNLNKEAKEETHAQEEYPTQVTRDSSVKEVQTNANEQSVTPSDSEEEDREPANGVQVWFLLGLRDVSSFLLIVIVPNYDVVLTIIGSALCLCGLCPFCSSFLKLSVLVLGGLGSDDAGFGLIKGSFFGVSSSLSNRSEIEISVRLPKRWIWTGRITATGGVISRRRRERLREVEEQWCHRGLSVAEVVFAGVAC